MNAPSALTLDRTHEHRVARAVRDVDLDDYQRTARRLLATPVVPRGDPLLLAAVRRWETELRADLAHVGRYSLDVTATGARLVRRPLVLDPHHPARTVGKSRRPFDPRRYAYLCLVLSALLTTGTQALLSDLGRRLADDAARVDGLGFDRDEHAHRTAFVDVVQWLVATGVIRLRDGSAAADLEEDALYDVEHEAVHLLVPSLGLRDLGSVRDRFVETYGDSRDERRLRARHRVLRLVLERPCVLVADLDDEERAWLQRNMARVAEDLERLTGLPVERRREGIALVDTEGDGSDRAFPGVGSPTQLGLLLGERLTHGHAPALVAWPSAGDAHDRLAGLLDAARAGRPTEATPPTSGGHEVPAWPLDDVGGLVAELVARHPGVRQDLRDNLPEATREAVGALLAMDLARVGNDADGRPVLVTTPPAARYRPTASPASARRDDDQLDLFGGAS